LNSTWDARLKRANQLSSIYPFAAQALSFYAGVATVQRQLYTQFEHAPADATSPTGELRDRLDSFTLLPKFPGFLTAIEQIAPAPLAQNAAALVQRGSAAWLRVIEDFWQSASIGSATDATAASSAEWCLAWLFLQPYAEFLAERCTVHVGGAPSRCPVCGAKPIVGVLRPEGDGARKSLVCMLCAHEWPFRRIWCPACGEEREPQMAFYSAPEIAHVRVDVCDTCRSYLKSVDLSKTGLAVPIVDELASLPLDLWASENGYAKLQVNMLGI
jgi:FdhE protein